MNESINQFRPLLCARISRRFLLEYHDRKHPYVPQTQSDGFIRAFSTFESFYSPLDLCLLYEAAERLAQRVMPLPGDLCRGE